MIFFCSFYFKGQVDDDTHLKMIPRTVKFMWKYPVLSYPVIQSHLQNKRNVFGSVKYISSDCMVDFPGEKLRQYSSSHVELVLS